MAKLFFLAVTCYALIAAGTGIISSADAGAVLGRSYPQSIHLIGNVDGKSIFVDNVSNLNWAQSSVYCKEMGMRLASITSPAQASLLFNSFNNFFNGTFWTSGRDSQQFRQFSWKWSETQPNSAYLTLGEKLSTYLTCLVYHSTDMNGTSLPHLDYQPCSQTFGVLCETT